MGQRVGLDSLQERIGHVFRDRSLLEQAMTHSSYVHETGAGREASNERLEFLGDAVLELAVSDYLYRTLIDEPEGKMTKARIGLVCEPALAAVAETLGIGDCLSVGRGEEKSGGRERPSITSDALEALIGALYLDGGMEAAASFIERFILTGADASAFTDSKTALQEYAQARDMGAITYRLIGTEGPDHARIFTVRAVIGGADYENGSGRSKKAAEQEAARATLLRMTGKQE